MTVPVAPKHEALIKPPIPATNPNARTSATQLLDSVLERVLWWVQSG